MTKKCISLNFLNSCFFCNGRICSTGAKTGVRFFKFVFLFEFEMLLHFTIGITQRAVKHV